MIKDNILRIKSDISLICQRLGRNPEDITIVGVTKFATIPMIEEAMRCGILHIGENKVQEALKKFAGFKSSSATKHMIGHLQTNKVKDALKIFDVIQSVDSLKLASALDKAAEKISCIVDILVQVNTSGEKQKFGVPQKDAAILLRQISKLNNVRVLGLMAIAPLTDERAVVRDCFRKLRELRDQVINDFSGRKNIQMNLLSMGMSSDYQIAIEEGSNMVRIGSAIFRNV